MTEWIDSAITPSLYNSNKHCILLMNDGTYDIGIYMPTDGWWSYTKKEDMFKEQFQCYLPFNKPVKNIKTETKIEWK